MVIAGCRAPYHCNAALPTTTSRRLLNRDAASTGERRELPPGIKLVAAGASVATAATQFVSTFNVQRPTIEARPVEPQPDFHLARPVGWPTKTHIGLESLQLIRVAKFPIPHFSSHSPRLSLFNLLFSLPCSAFNLLSSFSLGWSPLSYGKNMEATTTNRHQAPREQPVASGTSHKRTLERRVKAKVEAERERETQLRADHLASAGCRCRCFCHWYRCRRCRHFRPQGLGRLDSQEAVCFEFSVELKLHQS